MKKSFLIFITGIFTFSLNATDKVFLPHTESLTEAFTIPGFSSTFREDGNELRITYTFDSLAICASPFDDNWKYFRINGFGLNEVQGTPYIPCRVDHITTGERNTKYAIDHIECSTIDIPLVYSPSLPVQGNSEPLFSSEDIVPINETLEFYPCEPFEFSDEQIYRGIVIQKLYIRPVQYSSATRTAKINKEISVTLRKVPIRSSGRFPISATNGPVINPDDVFLAHTCQFCGEYKRLDSLISIPADRHYLILSHSDFEAEAKRFEQWKKQCGFSTSLTIRNTWQQEDVEKVIRDSVGRHSNLYYVLLIGDHTKISPHSPRVPEPYSNAGGYLTDFPYACLDGEDDYLPDLYIGRIPCASQTECTASISKLISYEECQTSNRIPSRAYFCTYFEDNATSRLPNGDGEEDRGFTYTTEKIYQSARQYFDVCNRLYAKTTGSIRPIKWSGIYANGDSLPEELTNPNFSWVCNRTHIIKALNGGCDLFFHRDHGRQWEWFQPNFTVTDLNSLHNSIFPIVLSIDCSVGQYNYPSCLSREFINMPNAGCSSIIAAQQNSNSIRNDAFSLGMFDAIWKDQSLLHDAIAATGYGNLSFYHMATCIGEMFCQGMLKVEETCWFPTSASNPSVDYNTFYHREIYHLFGDPSASLHWDTRDVCRAVSRVETQDSLLVEFYEGPAIFGLFDPSTGQSHRFFGNSVKYRSPDPALVRVKIFGRGMKTICADHVHPQLTNSNDKGIKIENVEIVGERLIVEVCGITDNNIDTRIKVGTVSGILGEDIIIPEKSQYNFELTSQQIATPSIYIVTLLINNQVTETKRILL